jgi:putative tricarboxylic transport membrane protein
VAVFIAGVWLWTVADSYAIATRLDRAGPELWPKIVLLLLLGATLWGTGEALLSGQLGGSELGQLSLLIRRASQSAEREIDTDRRLEGDSGDASQRRPLIAIAGILAMLSYVALLPYVGYAVGTFLLLWCIMLLAGYRRLVRGITISSLGTIAFFFVFQRIAYISLPLGSGSFRDFSITLMWLMGVR